MAVQNSSPQKVAAQYCSEPSQLVELCNHCPRPDCDYKDGCPEYKAVRSALSKGETVCAEEFWKLNPVKPDPYADVTDPETLFAAAWAKMDASPPPINPMHRPPAITIEAVNGEDCKHAQLQRLNTAIRAIGEYLECEDNPEHAFARVLLGLTRYRANEYEHLVDWDAVAGNGGVT